MFFFVIIFVFLLAMSSIPITLINFQKVKSHWLLVSLTIDNWQGPLWAVRYIAYSLNCAIPKYVCSATQVWNTFHFLCLRRAAPLHFKHTIKFSSRTLWFDPHFHYQICQQIVKLIIFGMGYIIWPFLQAASDNWLFYWLFYWQLLPGSSGHQKWDLLQPAVL